MSGTLRTSICERTQFAAGSVIADRYVLTSLIGAGGYGEVWYAKDASRNWCSVALKLLRPNSCSAVAQGRFESEMQALVLLRSHLHIVKLLDHGIHDGQRYMVMEYLSGGPLARWLNERKKARRLPALRQVWRWFDQVCQALGAAHLLVEPGPIIHRDINPNNVAAERNRTSNDPQQFEVLANQGLGSGSRSSEPARTDPGHGAKTESFWSAIGVGGVASSKHGTAAPAGSTQAVVAQG